MSLSRDERAIINEMALKIRELYNIDGAITDIDSIVQTMNGEIIEDSSKSSFSDGRIKKNNEDSFIIEVPSNQSTERRNFTIAHELGHLFLHMGFKTNTDLWNSQNYITYYRNGQSHQEYQANEFAAAFLMPKSIYRTIVQKNISGGSVNIAEVASYFHVSIDAAANRGKWLGYLEW